MSGQPQRACAPKRAVVGIRVIIGPLLIGVATMLPCLQTRAGCFWGATEDNPYTVSHPWNYAGGGGDLVLGICVDPDTPLPGGVSVNDLTVSLQNAAATYTRMAPTTGNVRFGLIPAGSYDFESALVHEIGHCIGLEHPNMGGTGPYRGYTWSGRGSDGAYDFEPGPDGVPGSHDDARDDDVNLHWFAIGINNPFTIPAKVDTTTYSLSPADLPAGQGHTFPANASREVAAITSGVPANSESVMHQLQNPGEVQRSLAHDDVATLRLAETGVGGIAGGSDDYTVTLHFVPYGAQCHLLVSFKADLSGISQCTFIPQEFTANHYRLTATNLYFHPTSVTWFFNQQPWDQVFTDDFENGDTGGWDGSSGGW